MDEEAAAAACATSVRPPRRKKSDWRFVCPLAQDELLAATSLSYSSSSCSSPELSWRDVPTSSIVFSVTDQTCAPTVLALDGTHASCHSLCMTLLMTNHRDSKLRFGELLPVSVAFKTSHTALEADCPGNSGTKQEVPFPKLTLESHSLRPRETVYSVHHYENILRGMSSCHVSY